MIFADFKALTTFRLSGTNPAPEISKMITLLERLHVNHCQFSEFVQTMLLLSALPHKWDHLASVYIQETKVENFSLVSLREQIIGEWERSNAGRASTSANKLSAKSGKVNLLGLTVKNKRLITKQLRAMGESPEESTVTRSLGLKSPMVIPTHI